MKRRRIRVHRSLYIFGKWVVIAPWDECYWFDTWRDAMDYADWVSWGWRV